MLGGLARAVTVVALAADECDAVLFAGIRRGGVVAAVVVVVLLRTDGVVVVRGDVAAMGCEVLDGVVVVLLPLRIAMCV